MLKSVSFKATGRGGWQEQEADGYHTVLSPSGFRCDITNQGYLRFEIKFDAPKVVTRIDTKGPLVKYSLLTVDGITIKKQKSHGDFSDPDFTKLNRVQCIGATAVFSTNPRAVLQVGFVTSLCAMQLSSLHECCERVLPQDLRLVCSDGTTTINALLASATSGMIEAKLGTGFSASDSVDLGQYKVAEVEIAKRIMLSRVISTKDVSPSVVELLHYLCVDGKDAVWPLVRETITVTNCIPYMCLADKFEDAPTRAATDKFFKDNAAQFIISDTQALLSAVEAKKKA